MAFTRRDVLGAAGAALALGACAPRGGRGGPSVLLLVADDLGRGDLGVLGRRAVATPRLDALAAEGLVAHRAYTPAALCRPSRAALLTGRYPHATGRSWYGAVDDSLAQWPDLFRRAGYATGLIGKTALPKHAERWGFVHDARTGGRDGASRGDSGRDPEAFGALVRDFLAAPQPFALVVAFYDPHRPGARAAEDPERLRATRAELARIEPPPNLARTDEVLVELRNYLADVERMDRAAGAVLDALEESGRADDTLVLFTSDNGADFPFAKATLYEAGIRLPFLARWPGRIAPGGETEALVSFVDVLPTALDAAGLAAPAGAAGRSFRAVLEGRAEAHRELVFAEHDEHRGETSAPSRAVVGPRFKYVRHFRRGEPFEVAAMRTVSWQSMQRAAAGDPALAARMRRLVERPAEELYDLAADPWELDDRAADPALAGELSRLRTALRAWMEAEGDPLLAEWDG